MDDVVSKGLETQPSPIAFDNSYARLPERFFARLSPDPVSSPRLIRLNEPLAQRLGIDPKYLASPAGLEILAGNRVPENAAPVAMAYAGHQFGHWSPQLGDGRAILLGEVIDRDGVRLDIHLKGSGRTPFSRRGDGRAALGPMLREYIVSEAMAAFGIPTTRSLAVVATGEHVMREEPLPGAVLTRIAESHVRIGTFEFFANQGDVEAVRLLADYVIARHYPAAAKTDHPYRTLLESVIGRTAALIARWQLVGFIHGVMNTDNMSIAGETIDYGPCAFMDFFDPATVYSSIDTQGRYAYGNQPHIAHWNLSRLAQALLPLLGEDADTAITAAQAAIDAFPAQFEAAYNSGFRRKLGLATEQDGDIALAQKLLDCMAESNADFTLTFRKLSDSVGRGDAADEPGDDLFPRSAAFADWMVQWRKRLALEDGDTSECRAAMRLVNPAFIPRNHNVEEALAAAVTRSDFTPLDELLTVLTTPYDDHPQFARYALPPKPEQVVQATFCGT
jgi:uncharacterized protein YdiU (UPF0061 family)